MGGLGTKDMTHKQRVIHRLKITRGHLQTVMTMVEEGAYCIDVINQTRAVENALQEINYLLLENHLKTCAVKLMKNGKTKQSVGEIMKVLKSNKAL